MTNPAADQTADAPAAECSAEYQALGTGRQCIRAAQHRGDHIDEHGFHWSDTVAVYPVSDGTFRRGTDLRAELHRVADEAPLSPDYQHPECGFHWHGRDGMDIPMRNGQPVCPRCELRTVERRLTICERRRDELRVESLRRGKILGEYGEKVRALEREIDGMRRQLGAEILRANQAEAAPVDQAAGFELRGTAEIRAVALREVADRYAKLADQNEAYELAEHGSIDHESRLQYEAVRDVVAGLRRMADEAQPTAGACACATGSPEMYEGPSRDCPVHGTDRDNEK